jgi:hypothetical protein
MPKTTIIFTGLLVFHHDARNSQFEVGVLRARAQPHSHELQIAVTPNPATGTGTLVKDRNQLESFVQNGDVRWNLDVELNGNPVEGLEFNAAEPSNRLDPTPQDDFGWVINIESNRFHGQHLARKPNRLQPVIFIKKGRLFTFCRTDSVDTIKGGEPNTTSELGFIAGGIGLRVDTPKGEQAVLRFSNLAGTTEIFRCTASEQRDYTVAIKNTPLSPMGGSAHFHLFYDRLFQGVAGDDRFDLSRHENPIRKPQDRCPEGGPAPDPFKCGGIRIDDGSGSLG